MWLIAKKLATLNVLFDGAFAPFISRLGCQAPFQECQDKWLCSTKIWPISFVPDSITSYYTIIFLNAYHTENIRLVCVYMHGMQIWNKNDFIIIQIAAFHFNLFLNVEVVKPKAKLYTHSEFLNIMLSFSSYYCFCHEWTLFKIVRKWACPLKYMCVHNIRNTNIECVNGLIQKLRHWFNALR